MRNPPWSRDELIVTLQFYLTHTPSIPRSSSSKIVELSEVLNLLQEKSGGTVSDKFRNPNGVYMKLMNLRRLDPDYQGKGLERGSKEELSVWNRYASNRAELHRVSEAIRSLAISDQPLPQTEQWLSDGQEAEEGKLLTRLHLTRERDVSLVRLKKQRALRHHKSLSCEGCNFDFEAFYGVRGRGFIECHHTKPLSELSPHGETIKQSDLSLLCSNCHRMVHKSRPWLSVSQLQCLVKNQNKSCPNDVT